MIWASPNRTVINDSAGSIFYPIENFLTTQVLKNLYILATLFNDNQVM